MFRETMRVSTTPPANASRADRIPEKTGRRRATPASTAPRGMSPTESGSKGTGSARECFQNSNSSKAKKNRVHPNPCRVTS